MAFTSTKVFEGFSTCFRQWRAEGTFCSKIHGYGISFKINFTGELDHRNWVWDFGGMKRAKGSIDGMNPKAWFDYMFDHTVLVAEDDPYLQAFLKMDELGVAQVRVLPATGAEKFAEFIYNKVNEFVVRETEGRVYVSEVEFREHNKNTAIYKPSAE